MSIEAAGQKRMKGRATVMSTYADQGVWSPIPVLDAGEVAACRAQIERLETYLGSSQTYLDWTHLFFPWSYQLVTRPRVLEAVRAVLGPDLLVQGSLLLTKNPQSRGYMSWHQDGNHSNFGQAQATTAWIALTESNGANGCMQVLPRSHQAPLPYHEVHDPDNLAKHATSVDMAIDPDKVCDLVLRPGEMSLHHPLIVHGSQVNRTQARRMGFIIRFGTPETQFTDPVLAVSGAGDYGHLKRASPPREQSLAHQVEAWRDFVARRGSSMAAAERAMGRE